MNSFNNHPLWRQHNIDSALSSLWDFYRKNFIPLFLMSLVLSVAIQYASTMVNMSELQSISDPMVLLEKMKGYLLPFMIISVISLLATTILHYYILFRPIDQNATVLASVLRSLRYFIPYLILIVLLAFTGTIAIALGIFILVVGAFFAMIYVATIYFFILPVMMVENTNIVNTITRTLKLAHKNFWQNIGWVVIFIVIMLVVSLLLSGIILIPFTGSFIKNIINPEDPSKLLDVANNPVFIGLSAVVSALTLPFMPIFACILYFNGKAREEQTVDQIAKPPDDYKVRVEDLYAKPYSEDHPDNPEKSE
jgi:hypothetical protein